MIVTQEFYDTLGQNARLNRMTSSRIESLIDKHNKLEQKVEKKVFRLGHSALLEFIQEKVRMEASIMMHDEKVTHLRFSRENCPTTYDLMVLGKLPSGIEMY